MIKRKNYIVRVTFEEVYPGKDEDEAIQHAMSQLANIIHLSLSNARFDILPDDKTPCKYGKLNRTCERDLCDECIRDDLIQAMNEDANDEKSGDMNDNMPVIPLKQLTYTPDQEKMVGSILDQLDIAERIKEDPGSIFEKGDSEVLEFAAEDLDTRYGKGANEKIAALLRLADLAKKLRK